MQVTLCPGFLRVSRLSTSRSSDTGKFGIRAFERALSFARLDEYSSMSRVRHNLPFDGSSLPGFLRVQAIFHLPSCGFSSGVHGLRFRRKAVCCRFSGQERRTALSLRNTDPRVGFPDIQPKFTKKVRAGFDPGPFAPLLRTGSSGRKCQPGRGRTGFFVGPRWPRTGWGTLPARSTSGIGSVMNAAEFRSCPYNRGCRSRGFGFCLD
jgi:hypothetical protein